MESCPLSTSGRCQEPRSILLLQILTIFSHRSTPSKQRPNGRTYIIRRAPRRFGPVCSVLPASTLVVSQSHRNNRNNQNIESHSPHCSAAPSSKRASSIKSLNTAIPLQRGRSRTPLPPPAAASAVNVSHSASPQQVTWTRINRLQLGTSSDR